MILIAEDEVFIAMDYAQAVKAQGRQALMARTVEDALQHFDANAVAVVLADHGLQKGGSARLYTAIRARGSKVPFCIITGYEPEVIRDAFKAEGVSLVFSANDSGEGSVGSPCGGVHFFKKPIHPERLRGLIAGYKL